MSTLFVEHWQHECCGPPFAVGDEVTWPLSRDLDRDALASVLGRAVADELHAAVDRHSDEAVPVTVHVTGVQAVFCSVVPVHGDAEGNTRRVGAALRRPGPGWASGPAHDVCRWSVTTKTQVSAPF